MSAFAALAALLLLVALAAAAALWRAHRSSARRLQALGEASANLAAGDMAQVAVERRDALGRFAERFNAMAAAVIERERRIAGHAFDDPLTGLTGRPLLLACLGHALRVLGDGGAVVLLRVDLVGEPGDAMLLAIAERLDRAFGHCLVARLGSGFALVSPRDNQADRLAQRLLDTIEAPLTLDGERVVPAANIGIAIGPGDGASAPALLANAEAALARAGAQGPQTFAFFAAELDRQAHARRALESDLRAAITGGQFELHFQPLFDLTTSRIGSFEALLRWHHPARGLVSPANFLPLAEASGLIVEIGGWALREACAHAATWPDHLRVAVNVSPKQVRHPGLGETILQTLAASGLDPARLELEVTEAAFAGGPAVVKALHGLRDLGVRIALDNFGAGASSLTCLHDFPFDRIKIDRSFIHQLLTRPGATAVLHAIAGLASALGVETTAEGVEESDQLAALRQHGCSSVQGYLFSRPVAPGEVLTLIAEEDSDRHRARA